MSLSWCIPARRAVVRKTMTYADLIDGWLAELDDQAVKAALARWYGLDGAKIDGGMSTVRAWAKSFFAGQAGGGGVDVARGQPATLDVPACHFQARLWKGPLRVLLEAEAAAAPLGDSCYDPKESSVEHEGGAVKLTLGDDREVVNADARFLMGDVVELPLWKLLAAGGLAQFGTKPKFDDKLRFDPEGSYLLGSPVRAAAGGLPPADLALHDNFVAMRFQMLLGLFHGAFYSLVPVYVGDDDRAPRATSGTRAVFARGLLYGATFVNPTNSDGAYWRVQNYYWGHHVDTAGVCPTKSGLKGLVKDFVVTPGSVCSATTLCLSNFVANQYKGSEKGNGSYGGNAVHASLADPGCALSKLYERWAPEDLAKVVEPAKDRLAADLGEVAAAIAAALSVSDGGEGIAARALAAAGEGLPEDARAKLVKASGSGSVEKLLREVNARLGKKSVVDPERAALARVHVAARDGIERFQQKLDALVASKSWPTYAAVPAPDFGAATLAKSVAQVRGKHTCGAGACVEAHAGRDVDAVAAALRKKSAALDAARDDPGQLLRGAARAVDLTDHLSDLNTVSLQSHEYGIVRLFPHRKLLDSAKLPTAGFLAAFDPLGGAACADDAQAASGQFWVFESSSTLKVYDGSSVCGAAPFRWKRVADNRFQVRVEVEEAKPKKGGTASDPPKVNVWFGVSKPSKKSILQLTRLRAKAKEPGARVGGGERPADDLIPAAHLADARPFRPIALRTLAGAPGKDAASHRIEKNHRAMVRSRAVPYPTILEAAGGWATWTEAERTQADLVKLMKTKEPADPGPRPAEGAPKADRDAWDKASKARKTWQAFVALLTDEAPDDSP